jgi:hypothetical protein
MRCLAVNKCILGVFLGFSSIASAQEHCATFQEAGIYNISSGSSNKERVKTFRHWFCNQNFSSSNSANSFFGSFGSKEVHKLLKLDIGASDEQFKQRRNEYCSNTESFERDTSSTADFVATINPHVVKAMSECFARHGLQARVVPSSVPEHFLVELKHNPSMTGREFAVINDFTALNASCINVPKQVGVSTHTISCKKDVASTAIVYVNSDADTKWNTPQEIAPIPGVKIRSANFDLTGKMSLSCEDPGEKKNSVFCDAGSFAAEGIASSHATSLVYRVDFIANAEHVKSGVGDCQTESDPHRSTNLVVNCGGISTSHHFEANNVRKVKHQRAAFGVCGSQPNLHVQVHPRGCTALKNIKITGELTEVTK